MFNRLLTLMFLLISLAGFCQTYPSSVSTTVFQPHSIFLDEYADPMSPKIQASVLFTDYTEPSRNIYLKFKLTGQNLTVQTTPGIKPPQAVNVLPGIPHIFSGADLDWYFNNNNLSFSGTTRAQLEANNNRLPEGMYTFCFEVYDYITDKLISLPGCYNVYLALNDPPVVIAPTCGAAIENLSQQNILFQWQVSNTNGSLNVGTLNFQLDLYEVNNSYSNPQLAIQNNQALPIWQSQPLAQTSFLYGPSEPPLEKGKRYVFTVKAVEPGKSQIKNNGYSQACWFYYGYPEGGTINIISIPDNYQFGLSDNGYFTWNKPSNVTGPQQQVAYQFKITPINPGQDRETAIINNPPFYSEYIPATTADPKNLALDVADMMHMQKMAPYVWQVKGYSGQQEIARSPVYAFTGPPIIEKFYAGGFEVKITHLDSFDSLTGIVSGKGKVILNNAGEAPEFSFSNIKLNAIGNNFWVMSSGTIHDGITINPYIILPDSVAANGPAAFNADSILITKDNLSLAGFLSWKFLLAQTSGASTYLQGKRQLLSLSHDFSLNSQDYNSLAKSYSLELLEPGGFVMNIDKSSQLYVTSNKYNLLYKGNVDLPETVKDAANSTVKIDFNNAGQLFFIKQLNNFNSEAIRLIKNTGIELKPESYVLDFSDSKSFGDFSNDPAWKGLYMMQAGIIVPPSTDNSGQLSASTTINQPLFNNESDNINLYVDASGLTTEAQFAYNTGTDTLKFNTFPAVDNIFSLSIHNNTVEQSSLSGNIRVSVLDTAGGFAYIIPINEFGLSTGYLVNGLSGYSFVFNGNGGEEQTINTTVTRAVFKNNNRLEMDINATWPHFNLQLNQLQKFCAWGNGNIGFENPNGIVTLSYQANASANGYDMQVERIGCGRVANVYSFGISSRITMSEDISGEDGAPIVNAYSMYKNPLLTGDISNVAFTVQDSMRVDSNGVRPGATDNLTTNLNQTLTDIGAGGSGSNASGNFNGTNGDVAGAIIPNSVYLDIQKVVAIAEVFIPFIDSVKRPKAQDYVTVIKQMLNSSEVRSAVNTTPEQLVNNLLLSAANSISAKIERPIKKISDTACARIRHTINTNAVVPVTSRIDTLIKNALERIKTGLYDVAGDNQGVKSAIDISLTSVRNNLSNEINHSIETAVENNVTSKITGFIQVGITNKVTGYIHSEVRTVATNIIDNGVANSVNLNNMVTNAGTMFRDVGDTIADAVTSLNLNTIKSTVGNIGDDIVSGISFEQIAQNILTELATKGLDSAITGLIRNQLNNLGGDAAGAASAILSSVHFDFSNVGDKIRNGQIDQIVKFDPTNIYIHTAKADIKGQLKFTKDDPIYGDSWQANVFGQLKLTKKDVGITAWFINGKTNGTNGFPFWFFKGAVTGLAIPLGSIPLTLDGFDGAFYHNMKKLASPNPVPDQTVNYGLHAGMYLYDTQLEGKILKMNVGIDAETGGGDFAVVLDGVANVGNSNSFSIATATGSVGYYSAEDKFQGVFDVQFNTAPLLCAGGQMGINVDGKNPTWEVYIGKRATPVASKILCKQNLSSSCYFDMKQSGISAGLMLNVSVDAQTPWLGGDNLKVQGFAGFGFGIDAYTNITFDPSFKIEDAYISVWASAEIGFNYETPVHSGSVTIAGVSLSGSLLYQNHDHSTVQGSLSGTATILNVDIGVSMDVGYDIGEHKRISG